MKIKIQVVKKGTLNGKPQAEYCPWFIGDWKGTAK